MIALTRRSLGLAAGMIATAALTAGALIAATAGAADIPLTVGDPAPDFTTTDIAGETVVLSALADRTVVIEFNNPACPYTMRHYRTGNMPRLQAEATSEGVVWLTINASGEGKPGYRDVAGMQAYLAETEAAPTHAILDPSGAIGHLYAAKATPHMYVIHEGVLVYQGAIDDLATASRSRDVAGAHNYVRAALEAIAAGAAIETPETIAYGCAMEFAS